LADSADRFLEPPAASSMTSEPAVALVGHRVGLSQMADNGLQVWLKECPCELTLNKSKE
jgi:hypothetical protein